MISSTNRLALLGLVTLFLFIPCAAQSQDVLFYDDFESGGGNWTSEFGTASISTVHAVSGTHSYIKDEYSESFSHDFSPPLNNVILSMMVYETPALTSGLNIGGVGNLEYQIMFRPASSRSEGFWGYRVWYLIDGGPGYWDSEKFGTTAPFQEGWNEVTMTLLAGDLSLHVNGQLVGEFPQFGQADRVWLAIDHWLADYETKDFWVDDVTITAIAPIAVRQSTWGQIKRLY